VLAFNNLHASVHVDHFSGGRIGRAVNSGIGTGSRLAGIVAVRGYSKGELQGCATICGKAHRASALRLTGWIGHVAMDFTRGSSGGLCQRGQEGEGQQAQPKCEIALHVLLLGSCAKHSARALIKSYVLTRPEERQCFISNKCALANSCFAPNTRHKTHKAPIFRLILRPEPVRLENGTRSFGFLGRTKVKSNRTPYTRGHETKCESKRAWSPSPPLYRVDA